MVIASLKGSFLLANKVGRWWYFVAILLFVAMLVLAFVTANVLFLMPLGPFTIMPAHHPKIRVIIVILIPAADRPVPYRLRVGKMALLARPRHILHRLRRRIIRLSRAPDRTCRVLFHLLI